MSSKISLSGLDDVIAAETELSHVDGEGGRLIVRGFDLADVVRLFGVEGTVGLLWQGEQRPGPARAYAATALGEARAAAHKLLPRFLDRSEGLSIMEGLRFGLATLSDESQPAAEWLLAGAVPVFVAALIRRARGLAPVPPDPSLPHAMDYLRMIRGVAPKPDEARAMDAYLTTVADHGLNASTFAARVVASTKAGPVWAVGAALAALKGPLHGGAPGPVLDMLDEIGTPDRAAGWIAAALSRGDRLMGFGHRVYRVRDPRADVLKGTVASLGREGNRLVFAEAVEQAALTALGAHRPGRRLDINVEFYTALLLEALEIPREAFTPTFAVGRVIGWLGHIMEQERTGRLIRPASRYVGPPPTLAA